MCPILLITTRYQPRLELQELALRSEPLLQKHVRPDSFLSSFYWSEHLLVPQLLLLRHYAAVGLVAILLKTLSHSDLQHLVWETIALWLVPNTTRGSHC